MAECVPLAETSDYFLGTQARPAVYSNLCVDREYNKTMSSALAAQGPTTVMNIPINSADLNDGDVYNLRTRIQAPMETVPSQQPYVPQDLTALAVDSVHGAVGYSTVYRKERPPTGGNLFRDQFQIPADKGVTPFQQPVQGNWNDYPDTGYTLQDPRWNYPGAR